jgi:hypothetical protein
MDPAAFQFPEGKADDYFTEDHWEAFVKVARVLGIDVAIGGGLVQAGGGLASTRRQWIWLKLTAVASGAYAWTRVVRDPASAAWLDTAESGTTTGDPARPANSDATLSTFPVYVRARREVSGELIFIVTKC